MTTRKMTKERFEAIVWAYGANPSKWPDSDRDAAIIFASSKEALALLANAQSLDTSLSTLPNPMPASEEFFNKLLDIPNQTTPIPTRESQPTPSTPGNIGGFFGGITADVFPGIRVPQLAGLFSACLLGIYLGASNIARYDVTVQTVDASAFFYSSPNVIADLKEFK